MFKHGGYEMELSIDTFYNNILSSFSANESFEYELSPILFLMFDNQHVHFIKL